MNATCQTLTPRPTPSLFSALFNFLGNLRFLPVHPADIIFVKPVNRDAVAAKFDEGPVPLPVRPDQVRMMSIRLP